LYQASENEDSGVSKDSIKNCKVCCNNSNISSVCKDSIKNASNDIIEDVIEDITKNVKALKEDKKKKCLAFNKNHNGITCHIITDDIEGIEMDFKQCFDEIYEAFRFETKNDKYCKTSESSIESSIDSCTPQTSAESNDSNCSCSFRKESSTTSSNSTKDFRVEGILYNCLNLNMT
jgi:hypothetical protein